MNNFIKQVIEEKFASKAQQRYFYAQAGKGGKKGKKWSKWAKEFSDKTDFKKLPNKVDEKETDIEEVIDSNGNLATTKTPINFRKKGQTSKSTSDKYVKSAASSMGTHGVHGTHTTLRYWAEGKDNLKKLIENTIDEIEMKDALGYDETLGMDASYKKAYNYFKNELKLSPDEIEQRLEQMGYNKKLAKKDKVNLIEKKNKFIEEFIESVLNKKTDTNDILKNNKFDFLENNPIIKRQLDSLATTLKNNNLSFDDIKEYLTTYE